MSKWKERINKILDSEQEKIERKLYEARGNLQDTGYDRYWKEVDRLEKELWEISEYREGTARVESLEATIRLYDQAIREYRNAAFDFSKSLSRSHVSNSRELIDRMITKLDIILGEKRL